jgi:plasmid stabilization system protein ParE
MKRCEVVLPQGAQADYLEGFAALGQTFDRHVEAGLEQLATFPESAPRFRNTYRRLVLVKLRYGVFYRIIGNRVIVSAIMHLAQDPKNILERLGELD